jgi:hypothetical protein
VQSIFHFQMAVFVFLTVFHCVTVDFYHATVYASVLLQRLFCLVSSWCLQSMFILFVFQCQISDCFGFSICFWCRIADVHFKVQLVYILANRHSCIACLPISCPLIVESLLH